MAGNAAGGTAKTEEKKDDAKVTPPGDETTAEGQAAGEGASGDAKTDKPVKQEKTFTKAELEAAAKKAVEDAKKKWDEEKDLTELERIKKENEELRTANRLRDAKDEVVKALADAGNKSPELAWNAMRGDLKFGDDGKLLNAKDLIDGLKTSFPEQFGTEKPKEGIDAGAGGGTGKTSLTLEQVQKMTPDEVNANWDAVQAVLSGK